MSQVIDSNLSNARILSARVLPHDAKVNLPVNGVEVTAEVILKFLYYANSASSALRVPMTRTAKLSTAFLRVRF
jgi:hypothetical protein